MELVGRGAQWSKRGQERVVLLTSVRYRILPGGAPERATRWVTGRTEDISPTGIKVRTRVVKIDEHHISFDFADPVCPPSVLEAQVQIGADRWVPCQVSVAWYTPLRGTREYLVGLTIESIADADREALDAVVTRMREAQGKGGTREPARGG